MFPCCVFFTVTAVWWGLSSYTSTCGFSLFSSVCLSLIWFQQNALFGLVLSKVIGTSELPDVNAQLQDKIERKPPENLAWDINSDL